MTKIMLVQTQYKSCKKKASVLTVMSGWNSCQVMSLAELCVFLASTFQNFPWQASSLKHPVFKEDM